MKQLNFVLISILSVLFSGKMTTAQNIPFYMPLTGLVGWYPFNNNVNDESGNANNATNYNATFTLDRKGLSNKATYFNGTSARIMIPGAGAINTPIITINSWIKVGSSSVGQLVTRRKWSNASSEQFAFDTKSFYVKRNGGCQPDVGWQQLAYTNAPPLDSWAMATVSYDGTTMKYYLNGNLENSQIVGSFLKMDSCLGADIIFGATWSSYPFYYTGYLDDVAIYNRALNAMEVKSIYNECATFVNLHPRDTNIIVGSNTLFTISASNANSFMWQIDKGDGFYFISDSGLFSGTKTSTLVINNTDLSLQKAHFRCLAIYSPTCLDTSHSCLLTITVPYIKKSLFWLPQNSLVAWYPFNGNTFDESGNGNHGIPHNVILSNDRFSNVVRSYNFNGTNANILVPYSNSLKTELITINTWVNNDEDPKSVVAKQMITKRNWIDATNEQYAFDTKSVYIKREAGCTPGIGWQNVNQSSSHTMNHWDMVSFSYDGRSVKYYLNGTLNDSIAFSDTKGMDTCNGGGIVMGANWKISPLWFKGFLDDISIYSRALNENEIKQVYTQCAKLIKVQPLDTSGVLNGIAKFNISSDFDSLLNYQWQINPGSGFQNINSGTGFSGINSKELVVSGLSSSMNNSLFRCLTGVNGSSCKDSSSGAKLSVLTTIVEETSFLLNSISIYPNPSKGTFYIHSNIMENEIETIEIFDLMGRKIPFDLKRIVKDGMYDIILGAEPGVYIIYLSVKNQILSKKLILD